MRNLVCFNEKKMSENINFWDSEHVIALSPENFNFTDPLLVAHISHFVVHFGLVFIRDEEDHS